jgi:hypothetical protein
MTIDPAEARAGRSTVVMASLSLTVSVPPTEVSVGRDKEVKAVSFTWMSPVISQ